MRLALRRSELHHPWMKLAEKGRFAPPPRLRGAAQRVVETIAGWENIEVRAHWLLGDESEVDGVDIYCGNEEVGHIHLDSEAHVFQPTAVASALIKAGLARSMPWSRSAVVFDVRTSRDVDEAIWLFRLSYDRRRGSPAAELLARVSGRRPSMDAGARLRPSREPAPGQ